MTYVSESFWHDAVNKATTDLFTFGYKHIIKPNFVFNHRPDEAHDQMIEFCHVVKNVPPLLLAEQLMLDYTDPILETNVMASISPTVRPVRRPRQELRDARGAGPCRFGFETVAPPPRVPARATPSRGSTVCLNTIR